MPISKRERAALWSARLGVTGLIEAFPQKPVLAVVNYHRIGDAQNTPYDSGAFSATAQEFDEHVGYLKKRFAVVGLGEAVQLVQARRPLRKTHVLITFDDGYLDNFDLAFPILRNHGVPGVFFLPTGFIGTGRLPWWDVIAYIFKKSRKRKIQLNYPKPTLFDIDHEGVAASLRGILLMAADPGNTDTERFIRELEQACDSPRPDPESGRCFLNWEEARMMQKAGMDFGSHTHSHEILSKLPPAQQYEELVRSRQILSERLGPEIDVLAYPVGLKHTFSSHTIEAARKAGYRAAFSYCGTLNVPPSIDPFDIGRFGVIGQSIRLFRLQMSLTMATGRVWF